MVGSIRAGFLPFLLFLLFGNNFRRSCFGFIFKPPYTPFRSWKGLTFTSPSSGTKGYSGLSFTRRRQSNNQHFFSDTALFVKKKNDWRQSSSIFRYLPGSSFESKGALEAGVKTALRLGNKHQRTQWTKDVSKRFSLIPPSMVSGCVDGLASAFAAIAPKDLQKALKPGGLEKVRSKIETDFVRNLRTKPIIQRLPIPNDDKTKLVEFLVELSLDFFLKDIGPILAAPSVKLQELDRERREIQNRMSFRQRVWYRVRYKLTTTVALGLMSLWTVFVTVFFVQSTDFKIKSFFSLLNQTIHLTKIKPFFTFVVDGSIFSVVGDALFWWISKAGSLKFIFKKLL